MDNRQIPDKYFEQLAGKIEEGIHAMEDNVEQEAPLLNRIGKLESYIIPEGYFDGLYSKLNLPKSRPSVIRRMMPYSIAASILMMMTLTWFWVNQNENTFYNQLALTEVYDYYIENESLFDQDLLIELSFEDTEKDAFDLDNLADEDLDLFTEELINEMTDQELLDIL